MVGVLLPVYAHSLEFWSLAFPSQFFRGAFISSTTLSMIPNKLLLQILQRQVLSRPSKKSLQVQAQSRTWRWSQYLRKPPPTPPTTTTLTSPDWPGGEPRVFYSNKRVIIRRRITEIFHVKIYSINTLCYVLCQWKKLGVLRFHLCWIFFPLIISLSTCK